MRVVGSETSECPVVRVRPRRGVQRSQNHSTHAWPNEHNEHFKLETLCGRRSSLYAGTCQEGVAPAGQSVRLGSPPFNYITPTSSEAALVAALALSPVIVYIAVGPADFWAYSGGVYTNPQCADAVNHAMVSGAKGQRQGVLVRQRGRVTRRQPAHARDTLGGAGAVTCVSGPPQRLRHASAAHHPAEMPPLQYACQSVLRRAPLPSPQRPRLRGLHASGLRVLLVCLQLVVGYDQPSRTLYLKNSWGAGW